MTARSRALGFLGAGVKRLGEPLALGEASVTSGHPRIDQERPVSIYPPARTAMSQGLSKVPKGGKGPCWKVAFDTMAKWENPLMGWTSTADPLENVARMQLAFATQEEAEAYCKKMGYSYSVRHQPEAFLSRPKHRLTYGDNFSFKRKGLPAGGLLSEVLGDVNAGASPTKAKAKGKAKA